jgi:hypothetical protein
MVSRRSSRTAEVVQTCNPIQNGAAVAEDTKTDEVAENAGESQRQVENTKGEGGEKEAGNAPHSDFAKPVIRSPFWPKWKCLQHYHVPLLEAVLLSCDMDPENYVNYFKENADDRDDDYGFEEFDLRMEIATRVSGEAFKVVRVPERNHREIIMVLLSEFAKWAKDMKQQSEEVWGGLPNDFEKLAVDPRPTWPWGSYTTKKLNALADAVGEFWKGYDEAAPRPDKHRTEDVLKYLTNVRKETVPPDVADKIDNIIRPDKWVPGRVKGTGLPKGSRKSEE